MLQGDGYEYPAVALRVAIGSGSAFLVAKLVDVFTPLASTIVETILDIALFFTIAFFASIPFFLMRPTMKYHGLGTVYYC